MNLLITGAWRNARASLGKLERLGHNVCFLQNEDKPLPCPYSWVEGVVCNGLFLHHPIEKFTNLRYVQLTSAGYDRVPMDYIGEHHIEIRNARGVYSAPMAEYAVCGVLALYKRLPSFLENQKVHTWQKYRDLRELTGKTVCVVGCGSVGTECAKRFAAFGCTVVGVDSKPYGNPHFSEMLSLDRLDEALKMADVIILTLPLTEQTHHLINADRLALIKPNAVLVNISRGGTVDTEALLETLQFRPSFGAVLDVFEAEPLPESSPLWKMPNIVITPHNSFVGEGNDKRLDDVILNRLKGDKNDSRFSGKQRKALLS